MSLMHLVAEAARLAGGDLCAAGHAWTFTGGRPGAEDEDGNAEPLEVYECARCGCCDYGYGHDDE